MKKTYIKPCTRTVLITVPSSLLAESIKGLQNDEGLNWSEEGIPDDEPDY